VLIATLALLAGLAGPASAVVHGYQHGLPGAGNHHVEHRHDGGDDHHHAPADDHDEPDGERSEHDHPRLAVARTQSHAPLTAAAMPVEAFHFPPATIAIAGIQSSSALRIPAERQTGPPSQPRAPPTR
jgi:hypothetical protein